MENKNALVATIVASVLTFSGGFFTGAFGYFNKDKELDIELVNIGLSILSGKATGEAKTIPARKFALRLLIKYTGVDIPDNELKEWATKGELPIKRISNTKPVPEFKLCDPSIIDPKLKKINGCLDLNNFTFKPFEPTNPFNRENQLPMWVPTNPTGE